MVPFLCPLSDNTPVTHLALNILSSCHGSLIFTVRILTLGLDHKLLQGRSLALNILCPHFITLSKQHMPGKVLGLDMELRPGPPSQSSVSQGRWVSKQNSGCVCSGLCTGSPGPSHILPSPPFLLETIPYLRGCFLSTSEVAPVVQATGINNPELIYPHTQ